MPSVSPLIVSSASISKVAMMATDKEVPEHLITVVLELEEADTKRIFKTSFWWYSQFTRVEETSIEKMYNEKKVTIACWQEIRLFWMYIGKCAPSDVAILIMTADTWPDVDYSMLKVNHALRDAAHSVPTSNNALLMADVVAPSQIQGTNFFKYAHVNPKDKTQILNFYNILVT